MRLAEAMRLGSLLRPQGHHALFGAYGEASCALGAALEAVGVSQEGAAITQDVYRDQGWGFLLDARAACPACDQAPDLAVAYLVSHLNDRHGWTREAIADWVETVEAPVALAAQEAHQDG